MIHALVVGLIILWLLGFTLFHIGPVIHAVLVIALVVFVFNMLTGRKTAL